jgi:hypothetical protein
MYWMTRISLPAVYDVRCIQLVRRNVIHIRFMLDSVRGSCAIHKGSRASFAVLDGFRLPWEVWGLRTSNYRPSCLPRGKRVNPIFSTSCSLGQCQPIVYPQSGKGALPGDCYWSVLHDGGLLRSTMDVTNSMRPPNAFPFS